MLGRSKPEAEHHWKTRCDSHVTGAGGWGAVAQRKGYYRAAHYVKPSSASSRWKKPSTGVILVVGLVAVAGWNTLVGNDSGQTEKIPQPRPSGASAPADPGQ
ncbi:hypothetical protein RKD22_000341 [Streptomyces pristinaespiralis]